MNQHEPFTKKKNRKKKDQHHDNEHDDEEIVTCTLDIVRILLTEMTEFPVVFWDTFLALYEHPYVFQILLLEFKRKFIGSWHLYIHGLLVNTRIFSSYQHKHEKM